MLTYKAAYQFGDDGWVVGQVLDFPGAVTQGKDLDDARRMLQSALVDMVESFVEDGEPIPKPDPSISVSTSDLEEPIHLLFQGASVVQIVPVGAST